jgi:hypothetical protein
VKVGAGEDVGEGVGVIVFSGTTVAEANGEDKAVGIRVSVGVRKELQPVSTAVIVSRTAR